MCTYTFFTFLLFLHIFYRLVCTVNIFKNKIKAHLLSITLLYFCLEIILTKHLSLHITICTLQHTTLTTIRLHVF